MGPQQIRTLNGAIAQPHRYWQKVKYNPFTVGDLRTWVRTHCTGSMTIGDAWLYFELDADAMLFKLSH